MRYAPTVDRVLVLPMDPKALSEILIIPETAKEKPSHGKVVAVGPDVKQVKVDDVIVYGKYSGAEIVLDRDDYIVMREHEVDLVERKS